MKNLTCLCIGIVLCTELIFTTSAYSQVSHANTTIQKNGPASNYLEALLRFEPWAESVWKDYPQIENSGYFGDGQGEGSHGGIRGTCNIALSYAVLIRAFPDAPGNQHRLKRVEAALRYAAETHKSGIATVLPVNGKKWGVVDTSSTGEGKALWDRDGWQTPLWASTLGFTAALLEKEIDPNVVEACKRVVAAEADFRSKLPPASGYKLDTKVEENGWQSNILALAAAWMPQNPGAKNWMEAAKLYMANTYTVPADLSGPLKEWIKTQTLFPSYAAENHGFYHPGYHESGSVLMGYSYLMASMINPSVAKELKPFAEHNVLAVWQFLKGLLLNSGEFAFPSGQDWGLHGFGSYLTLMATHFCEPEAQWAEPRLAKLMLNRQAVNCDGRFVGDGTANITGDRSKGAFYPEANAAFDVALSYLYNEMAGFPTAKGSLPENHISNYPDIGLIFQRNENALITINYGSESYLDGEDFSYPPNIPIPSYFRGQKAYANPLFPNQSMILVYPSNGTTASQQFLISPNTSSYIGTDGKTTLKDFKTTTTGFRAELNLNGIKGRRSRVIINSSPEAVVFLEIPADTLNRSQDEWFLTAIENDALTGGTRTVLWKGNSAIIKERSGTITSPISTAWLNVDDWIGFIALTQGEFIYRAASDYNREGAAEDAIVFHPAEKEKPRAVIVLPGKNAEVTAAFQKNLKWTISEKEFKLSFKMPDGKMKTIQEKL